MDSPPPVNVGTGSSSRPDKRIIEDLHYKYLFFLTTLDNSNLVGMLEEEKRLFAFANTYKQYMFMFDNSVQGLEEFQKYTRKLTQNVIDNYMSIFRDKSLDITGFVNETDSNDAITKSFRALKGSLQSIAQSSQPIYYITCVLVCSVLLFLVRTTKRSLFMYLSQKKNDGSNNATLTPNVVKAVISNAETVDVNIKEKLANVILYVSDFITSIQQLVLSEVATKGRCLLMTEAATQKNNAMLKELQESKRKCAEENEALKKELAEQLENMQKLQSEEGKKAMMEKLANKTKELKTNLSGIMQLAANFDKLFKRWDQNNSDNNLIAMKMRSLNDINKPTHLDNALYTNGLEMLVSKIDQVQSSLTGNLKNDTDNIIIRLVYALLQLDKEKVIMQPDGLEMFFGGSEIYGKLVLLYEELSGAVRAVVRVRNVYATSSMNGGRKRKSSSAQSLSKRRRLLSGGSVSDESRFKDYSIQLDKKNKLVEFVGIDPNDKVFKPKTLRHGPFFSVHDNTLNNSNATSIEDDLLRGIEFDSLVNMFSQGTPEKDKEPAIILYTYGYSGSGKSYTLFGEKTLTSIPKAGVVWEMVRRLQGSFDLKLVNTTICYGYLDYQDNGYVFKTNDPRPSNKDSKDVKAWANIINTDFADALRVENDDSFIKVTPNNPESSRGFYIVKFALYEKGTNYRNVRGYIGVVDMAGNEDPFDIAATICPTMKFNEMNTLLSSPSKINQYDIVYENMQRTFKNVLTPTVLTALAMKFKGTTSFDEQANRPNPFESVTLNSLEGNAYRRLIVLRDQLPSIAKMKGVYPGDKTQTSYITKTKDGVKDVFTYVDSKAKVEDTFLTLPSSGPILFNVHAGLMYEICKIIEQENEPKVPEIYRDKVITVNDIRQVLLQGQTELVDVLKIKYAMYTLGNIMKQTMGTKDRVVAALVIDAKGLTNALTRMAYYDIVDTINNEIEQAVVSLSNSPYLLPFESNQKPKKYRYSTIARIIKEGYYINKANAELMDYFKKKLHMQDVSRIVTVKKGYDFNKSFAFNSYNKFARDFVPISGNSARNSAQKDFEYDTGLVDIIKKQFPGKNKDIIFACVRNDKDFGKILGAIDTLELIRDLKST